MQFLITSSFAGREVIPCNYLFVAAALTIIAAFSAFSAARQVRIPARLRNNFGTAKTKARERSSNALFARPRALWLAKLKKKG